MIAAIAIGRKGSTGLPGKNTMPVLGRPLCAYPMLAARNSRHVDRLYVSTDDEQIAAVARAHGAEFIQRPPELATREALGEHVFQHAHSVLQEQVRAHGQSIEMLVLLMCNAATILASTIDAGIEVLRADSRIDSAVTVSCYNMWSPLRARRLDASGLLQPFVPFETFGDPATLNCDRDSQGDVWFADMGVSLIRPRCIENLAEGLLPQKWMGRRIYPLKQAGGCDIDFGWQVPGVESWLKNVGFTELNTPYDRKK